MKNIAEFLFQLTFLKKTPRTGYRFLGSGGESVADHSYGTMVIGYALAALDPLADQAKVLKLCLFHDAVEARTGDQNYVYKQYVKVDAEKALEHLIGATRFGVEVRELIREYEEGKTREAGLAHDADQLDLLLTLKEQKDLNNPYAQAWIENLLKRLATKEGKRLAEAILENDHTDWWFRGNDSWWVKDGGSLE